MIELASKKKGWGKTDTFLERVLNRKYLSKVDKYAAKGVEQLRDATPVNTGETALSWHSEVNRSPKDCTIIWANTNVHDYCNVALLLDKGHATRDGNWVEGQHFIAPALSNVFGECTETVWKEVTDK